MDACVDGNQVPQLAVELGSLVLSSAFGDRDHSSSDSTGGGALKSMFILLD
jgi:hypothetical protein